MDSFVFSLLCLLLLAVVWYLAYRTVIAIIREIKKK